MPALRMLIMSDLHQGDGGSPYDPSAIEAEFDIAIVAGDCAGRLTSSLHWLADRFSGFPIIYVPGNHDFYRDGGPDGFTIESEIADGRDLAAKTGIHLLIDDAVELSGYRFLGSTLWTDFRAGHSRDLAHACGEAKRGMNDYRRIHRASATRRSRRLQPADTLAMHRRSRNFLSEQFRTGDASRTIVVTHHAPSMTSLRDPFESLNQCYASDLDAEIMAWRPAMWVHGHIHQACDYRLADTRILCNPAGRAEETTGFDPALVVTMAA